MGFKENKFKRVLSKSYRQDSNKIKISSANTNQHEILKSMVAVVLINKKHEIVTEAIFEGPGRADVFDLTTGIVYEILHSEEEKSFLAKKDKYPIEINEIVAIRTKDYIGLDMNSIINKLKEILI